MRKFILLATLMILAFLVNIRFCCFSAASDIEIVSVRTGRTINGVWAPSSYFFHNDDLSVEVTAQNTGVAEEAGMIYVSALDKASYPIGFSEANVTFFANETKTAYFSIHIPTWARAGDGSQVTASTESSAGITIYFTIPPGIPSYLTLRTSAGNKEIDDMHIWFDGNTYPLPVTFPLIEGTYSVRAETRQGSLENDVYYIREFSCWDDGSTSNPRTVNVSANINMTLTANYISHRYAWQPR
jgi:hypothetical protein